MTLCPRSTHCASCGDKMLSTISLVQPQAVWFIWIQIWVTLFGILRHVCDKMTLSIKHAGRKEQDDLMGTETALPPHLLNRQKICSLLWIAFVENLDASIRAAPDLVPLGFPLICEAIALLVWPTYLFPRCDVGVYVPLCCCTSSPRVSGCSPGPRETLHRPLGRQQGNKARFRWFSPPLVSFHT